MAKPINHDTASTLATAGGQGMKWGLIALLALPVAGAAIGAIAFHGTVAALIGLALGGAGSFALAPELAIGGGLLGLVKGGNQAAAEKDAFNARVEQLSRSPRQQAAQTYNNGEIAGVQQGYQVGMQDGFQQGQQAVIQQLQQHIAEQQAAETQAAPAGGFASKVAAPAASKTEMVDGQRAAQANAGMQIG